MIILFFLLVFGAYSDLSLLSLLDFLSYISPFYPEFMFCHGLLGFVHLVWHLLNAIIVSMQFIKNWSINPELQHG